MRLSILSLSAVLLMACPSADRSRLGDGFDTSGANAATSGTTGNGGLPSASGDASTPPMLGCNKMDILFIIDNSGSMREERENLVANFPRFVQVLETFQGGSLDYRVGVTTTALGDISIPGFASSQQGALQKTPAMQDPWLDSNTPDLPATFAEVASVTLDGNPIEQPLKAARYALEDRIMDGTNAGFLRDDALLALIFLTDEDDGSVRDGTLFESAPVSDFIQDYGRIAKGGDRWAAAVIAAEEDCESEFGDASRADRLLDFAQQAGDNVVFGSICSGDLSAQLDQALSTFNVACQQFVPII